MKLTHIPETRRELITTVNDTNSEKKQTKWKRISKVDHHGCMCAVLHLDATFSLLGFL